MTNYMETLGRDVLPQDGEYEVYYNPQPTWSWRQTWSDVQMPTNMTRQHFEAIARAIARVEGLNTRRRVVDLLIPELRQFNPNFDANRFRLACNAPHSFMRMDSQVDPFAFTPTGGWFTTPPPSPSPPEENREGGN